MDDNARLQLQQMIKANDVLDQTPLIRQLKHSSTLRQDISSLLLLKKKYHDRPDLLVNEAMIDCQFLFTYYTDIFNKVRKDEIDLAILFKFLDVLQQIEEGQLDQHEGSFTVGKLLKELYVDSALRKADKLNLEHEKNKCDEPNRVEPVNISWKQFKYLGNDVSKL
jgi:hypothetical protein